MVNSKKISIKNFIFFVLKFLFIIVLINVVFAKEKIKIVSYITDESLSSIIKSHIERYKNSNVLSLFEIYYTNFDNLKEFDMALNEETDIVIAPAFIKKVIEERKKIRYWNDYFNNTPTFFAVFKTYTFDFMKNLSYVDGKVEFLPFFAYSFYYTNLFPNLQDLNIIELLSVYNAFIYTTDYINFYSKYLRRVDKNSYLKPLIGQINEENAKIFKINDKFILMDSPFVMYGIFLTSYPANISKQKAIDFVATKIWDFETQIDLALSKGVLTSDKNTTLHPGFIQKLKDKSFALHYNNSLGKIKEYQVDYGLFYNVFKMVVNEYSTQEIANYLNSYLYSPLINSELLYSNYYQLTKRSGLKNYLIAIFEDKKVEKIVYTPDFIKKNFDIISKSSVSSKKTVKDMLYLILWGKEDLLKNLQGYKLDYYQKQEMTMIHRKNKEKLVFIRRKSPKYTVVVIMN